jgi:tetratricopeptide (TPR) repeat protein
MATKKKTATSAESNRKTKSQNHATPQSIAEYERALDQYSESLSLLHDGKPAEARERFLGIAEEFKDESVLAERCRRYAEICTNKLAPAPEAPTGVDDCYHQAVLLSNNGRADDAIRLLDQALQIEPQSPRLLYARAAAWALKSNAEAAVGDLRQAIVGEPQIRFQAANDPDFEAIREEPSFIDIIEPTPTGA